MAGSIIPNMENERNQQEYLDKIRHMLPNNKRLREIDFVRKTLVESINITDLLIDEGIVDPVDLANIAKDKYMQIEYMNMMKMTFEGKISSKHVDDIIFQNNQTYYCGWIDFQKRYFEKKFQLKLISPTEDSNI